MTFTAKAYYLREHGDAPVSIANEGDVDALVDALSAGDFANSIAALYVNERPLNAHGKPDHELRVALDSDGKVGSVRYTTAGKSWYASGAASARDEVFYYYMGNDEGFPQDSEIGIDTLRAVAKEFLVGGGDLPGVVEWKIWPHDQV